MKGDGNGYGNPPLATQYEGADDNLPALMAVMALIYPDEG